MATATPKTKGRPPTYRAEFAVQAAKLCALGATDAELADFFGVHERTIGRWQATHPEFGAALKAGKERADERVERSLYQRAVGYTREAVKVYFPRDSRTPVLVPYPEHVPPDTRAALSWLKNRCPGAWRDHQERPGKDVPVERERTVVILPHNGRD